MIYYLLLSPPCPGLFGALSPGPCSRDTARCSGCVPSGVSGTGSTEVYPGALGRAWPRVAMLSLWGTLWYMAGWGTGTLSLLPSPTPSGEALALRYSASRNFSLPGFPERN